jgi:hypothetical protein
LASTLPAPLSWSTMKRIARLSCEGGTGVAPYAAAQRGGEPQKAPRSPTPGASQRGPELAGFGIGVHHPDRNRTRPPQLAD